MGEHKNLIESRKLVLSLIATHRNWSLTKIAKKSGVGWNVAKGVLLNIQKQPENFWEFFKDYGWSDKEFFECFTLQNAIFGSREKRQERLIKLSHQIKQKREDGAALTALAEEFATSLSTIHKIIGHVKVKKASPKSEYLEENKEKLIKMRESGWSITQIAEHFRVSDTTIKSFFQKQNLKVVVQLKREAETKEDKMQSEFEVDYQNLQNEIARSKARKDIARKMHQKV